MMFVAAAREVISAVKRSQHRLLLVGVGSRVVGPWLAYYRLRSEGYGIDVMTGNGQIGYTPLPGEAFVQSAAAMRTSKMLADTVTAHGVLVGGGSRCLSILGAAQIDRFANINSTKLSADRFLVGSGGGNDSVNATEVIVIVNQSRTRFPESVPYITSPGDNVTAVVSSMGVFRKNRGKEKLRLAACFPDPAMSRDELIGRIREECGWPLETAETVEEMPRPTREELAVLRWLRSSPPAGTGDG
jgi:acyl CoA:acetate/3-ketoacid CoA transferase beta subunit